MDNPPNKSTTYEEYCKQRSRSIGDFTQQGLVPVEEECIPPVPLALARLDDKIEELSKQLSSLDEKLRSVSTAPVPETADKNPVQPVRGNSEFARRVFDSCDRINNLGNRVLRMIHNLEI